MPMEPFGGDGPVLRRLVIQLTGTYGLAEPT